MSNFERVVLNRLWYISVLWQKEKSEFRAFIKYQLLRKTYYSNQGSSLSMVQRWFTKFHGAECSGISIETITPKTIEEILDMGITDRKLKVCWFGYGLWAHQTAQWFRLMTDAFTYSKSPRHSCGTSKVVSGVIQSRSGRYFALFRDRLNIDSP